MAATARRSISIVARHRSSISDNGVTGDRLPSLSVSARQTYDHCVVTYDNGVYDCRQPATLAYCVSPGDWWPFSGGNLGVLLASDASGTIIVAQHGEKRRGIGAASIIMAACIVSAWHSAYDISSGEASASASYLVASGIMARKASGIGAVA